MSLIDTRYADVLEPTNATIASGTGEEFLAERQALERILRSPLFQRAPNLTRILAYICDQYFKGAAHKLKEYNIAVEALGRRSSFDPQSDAIVRVNLHALRKKLTAYYAELGSDDELQIVLRAGCYAPEFVPLRTSQSHAWQKKVIAQPREAAEACHLPIIEVAHAQSPEPVSAPRVRAIPRRGLIALIAAAGCGVLGVAAGILLALSWFSARNPRMVLIQELPLAPKVAAATFLQTFSLGSVPDTLMRGIRIRCGSSTEYVDTAGFRWQPDAYFSGGTAYSRPVDAILRSRDPALYATGREGIFQYDIPVPPGKYEVHLLFAETQSGIEDGTRVVAYTVGLGQSDAIDIVSEAGAVNAATERVYANVTPGPEGTIHLKVWSLQLQSSLNAIEILPQRGDKPGPVRISTLNTLYEDSSGGHWLPDRYFRGGRTDAHDFARVRPEPPLFSHERFGSFDYSVPVAKGFKYLITLYMGERYWGSQYSGLGGPGSRLFTVRCNDLILLSKFDLAATQKGNNELAVQFHDLVPDASGKFNLSFIPDLNYGLINAIEITPQ